MEDSLGVNLPEDYQEFTRKHLNEEREISFRLDIWHFWSPDTVLSRTLELRENDDISNQDIAIASNQSDRVLFFKHMENKGPQLYIYDDELGEYFYAFSLCEFRQFESLEPLLEELDSAGFEHHNLKPFENCPGSLFEYAKQLNVSEEEENYSEKRVELAMELFRKTAEAGHPEAANEMADYYYFKDATDVEKIIQWRERAITNGHKEARYELADFLIDYKLESIDRAVELLESLVDDKWYGERALLKVSRVYMRGTGGKTDYEKGINYVKRCVEFENYNALSDYAYYYYHGIGVKKDARKALSLLKQAEKLAIEKSGYGMWEEFIQKIEKELH